MKKALTLTLFLLTAGIASAQFNLSLNKSVVAGQNYVQGTITLDAISATPSVFQTYDNSSLVTTPPTVTVSAGLLSRAFAIQTMAVNSTINTTIYAKRNNVVKSQPLTLAPLVPVAMEFVANPVKAGLPVTCRLVINGVAGPGGRTVSIYDNSAYSDVPPSVNIPAGASQTTFQIVTRTVPSTQTVTVTAIVSAGGRQGTFRIQTTQPMRRIVCESDIAGGNMDIWIMDEAFGGAQTRLTTDVASDHSPSLSPDGTRIVFVSNRSGQNRLYWMNINGTNQTLIPTSVAAIEPSWGPDGSIAFESASQIYKVQVDGSNETQLTSGFYDRFPAWSPNGQHIAFSREGDVWKMNADGSNPVDLTNRIGNEEIDPSWSPDGLKIVYAGEVTGHRQVWVMNSDGTGQTQLTFAAVSSIESRQPSYSVDGNRIAYTYWEGGIFNVWSMDLDGSDQQATTAETSFVARNPCFMR